MSQEDTRAQEANRVRHAIETYEAMAKAATEQDARDLIDFTRRFAQQELEATKAMVTTKRAWKPKS